jgi:SPP1 family predicted phage head-tail adaptor
MPRLFSPVKTPRHWFPMPPQAGRLNHRIQIQQRDSTQGSSGQPATTWTTLCTVWARIVSIGGAESYRGQQLAPEITHLVTLRWRDGITSLHRVLTDDGHYLDILFPNYAERHRDDTLTLHCKERVAWQPLND